MKPISNVIKGYPIGKPSEFVVIEKSTICPQCNGQGFFRGEFPLGHPMFGRAIPCNNEFHVNERISKIKQLSRMSDYDLELTLEKIKPVNTKVETHCNWCKNRGGHIVELEKATIGDYEGMRCRRCGIFYYLNNEGYASNLQMIDAINMVLSGEVGFFLFWGGYGAGKTLGAKVLAAECIRNGKSVIYANYHDISSYLKSAWNRKNNGLDNEPSEEQRFEQLLNCKVLIIDEWGRFTGSEWERLLQFRLINNRYEKSREGKVTVIISNNSPNYLDGALISRMGQNTINAKGEAKPRIVHVTSPDMRVVSEY